MPLSSLYFLDVYGSKVWMLSGVLSWQKKRQLRNEKVWQHRRQMSLRDLSVLDSEPRLGAEFCFNLYDGKKAILLAASNQVPMPEELFSPSLVVFQNKLKCLFANSWAGTISYFTWVGSSLTIIWWFRLIIDIRSYKTFSTLIKVLSLQSTCASSHI